MEIKRCPHCGERGELMSKTERVGYDEYMRYVDSFQVVCTGCGARTKEFTKKPLVATTHYTVVDFRDNPTLRAKVEDEYVTYCELLEQATVDAWNTRPEAVPACDSCESYNTYFSTDEHDRRWLTCRDCTYTIDAPVNKD